MKMVQTKYAGWGLVAGALATAFMAFPIIAQTADAQRQSAAWQARANSIDEAGTDDVSSDLVIRLADMQTETSMTAHMRDVSVTDSLLSYKKSDLDKAVDGSKELHCMSEAIYFEARSETRSGQKAVAEVILNRVDSKHFPDTVCGVVYQGSERRTGCQFSFTCDGSMDKMPKGKAWKRSQDVAQVVMTGGVVPFTNRATHYHTTAVNPPWSSTMRMTRQVGSHVFYRFAPRDYTPSEPAILAAPPS